MYMEEKRNAEFFKRLRYNEGRRKITECLNYYFGCDYESYTQVTYNANEEYTVWFVQVAKKENGKYVSTSSFHWVNVFSDDEELLFQNNPDAERMRREEKGEFRKYIVFAHDRERDLWCYKGIYVPCGKDPELGFVHCRIGINVRTEEEQKTVDEKQKRVLRNGVGEAFRMAAIRGSSERPAVIKTTETAYQRNEQVARYTKFRAKGVCQLCGNPAPFQDKNGHPFLEVHHIKWLSEGGADSIYNTVAICPNCHRKMHHLNEARDIEYLFEQIRNEE